MGGFDLTERMTRPVRRRHDADADGVSLETIHYEVQDLRETLEPMKSLLQQSVVDYDNLQRAVSARDRNIEDLHQFCIVWEESLNGMHSRFEKLQDQLILKQSGLQRRRTQAQDLRMRSTLHRLERALQPVTKEDADLRQRLRSNVEQRTDNGGVPDSPFQSQKEQQEPMSEATKIRRKKGIFHLRPPKLGGDAPQSNNSPDEPLQFQKQQKGQPAQLPTHHADFEGLNTRLKAAEAHIINIGGNLGALLPREVLVEDFKSLVSETQIWVRNYLRPAISSVEQCFQAFERTQSAGIRDTELGISRVRNQDFRAASEFPGADVDIFRVIIFDLLVDRIFCAKLLYGSQDLQEEVDVISALVPSMILNSKSSRSLYNARRWMSEAMTAILAQEKTQRIRHDFSHGLADSIIRAISLEAILGSNNQAALEDARSAIREKVVLPAIELGDKMICAIDKFSLDVQSYWSQPCAFRARFFRDLEKLDCKNLAREPPRFKLNKIQKLKKLSEDAIKSRLRIICPAVPALILKETHDKDYGPPTTLVKQEVWVAWNEEEAPKLSSEQLGYFWFLYNEESTPCGK
ncbi:hypothetical protein diail_7642 [Diaporthe ilicicola]|nr:hypothetical protein diail_7642 [Diaporthe ilicicola]